LEWQDWEYDGWNTGEFLYGANYSNSDLMYELGIGQYTHDGLDKSDKFDKGDSFSTLQFLPAYKGNQFIPIKLEYYEMEMGTEKYYKFAIGINPYLDSDDDPDIADLGVFYCF
jgi:hypothetical protein